MLAQTPLPAAQTAGLKPLFRMHAELCKAMADEHRQAIHHPSIDVMTYAEAEAIPGNDGNGNGPAGYHAKIRQKAKVVDGAACTGCRQCEMACNVAVPDEYNVDMRRPRRRPRRPRAPRLEAACEGKRSATSTAMR